MPRCAECGFLAVRDFQYRNLAEVEAGMRKDWAIPVDTHTGKKRYVEIPLCFKFAADFNAEVEVGYSVQKVLEVINRDRPCDKFVQWCHGRTPREHEEMQLLEEQRKFQAAQREADLKFQAEVRESDRRWQAEQKAKELAWQDDQNRKNRQSQFSSGLIAAIAGALAGALAGFISGKPDPATKPENPPAVAAPAPAPGK